jgi:hypothetical protein
MKKDDTVFIDDWQGQHMWQSRPPRPVPQPSNWLGKQRQKVGLFISNIQKFVDARKEQETKKIIEMRLRRIPTYAIHTESAKRREKEIY